MTGISRWRWRPGKLDRARADGLRRRLGARTRRGSSPRRRASFRWPRPSCSRPPGPPPADTAVTFVAGEPRVIVLRHGPPENVVFAEVSFAAECVPRRQRASREGRGPPAAGRIRARPRHERAIQQRRRPSSSSTPDTSPRPAKARASLRQRRAVRARARDRPGAGHRTSSIALLPPTRPATDNLAAPMPAPGTYLVAAPESTVELRRLRRARPPGRRHGARDPPGGARRRHAGLRVRQAPPGTVRLPARVARGGRALGPVHLSLDRPARGVSLPRTRLRALDRARRDGIRWPTDLPPLEHLGGVHAPPSAGGRARPAALHRRGRRLPRLRHRADDRVAAGRAARRPRPARCGHDGGRHAAGARQPVQPRHRDRERGGRAGRGRRRSCAGSMRRPRRGSTTGSRASPCPGRFARWRSSRPPRFRPPSRPTPTSGSRTTCVGSRSTSPRATPSRPCSPAGSSWPRPTRFSPTAICAH